MGRTKKPTAGRTAARSGSPGVRRLCTVSFLVLVGLIMAILGGMYLWSFPDSAIRVLGILLLADLALFAFSVIRRDRG